MSIATPLLILDQLNAKFKLNPTGQATFQKAKEARAKIQSKQLTVPDRVAQKSGQGKALQGNSGNTEVPMDSENAYKGGEIKDSLGWAKFAEPDDEILNSLVSPTKEGRVNSETGYRDVPAGTEVYNISKKNGKQINTGADFFATPGEALTNPFAGEAKVVRGLGLTGAGNSVSLEYTLPSGKKLYADLNHNESNLVKPGDVVKPGQAVAKAGKTGNANGVHSDFAVYSLEGKSPIYFDTSKKFKQK